MRPISDGSVYSDEIDMDANANNAKTWNPVHSSLPDQTKLQMLGEGDEGFQNQIPLQHVAITRLNGQPRPPRSVQSSQGYSASEYSDEGIGPSVMDTISQAHPSELDSRIGDTMSNHGKGAEGSLNSTQFSEFVEGASDTPSDRDFNLGLPAALTNLLDAKSDTSLQDSALNVDSVDMPVSDVMHDGDVIPQSLHDSRRSSILSYKSVLSSATQFQDGVPQNGACYSGTPLPTEILPEDIINDRVSYPQEDELIQDGGSEYQRSRPMTARQRGQGSIAVSSRPSSSATLCGSQSDHKQTNPGNA